MDLLLEEHKKILFLLIKHNVKFILIGGYAVIYHGYERTTGDMDIWLEPANENRDKFVAALKEHGTDQKGLDILINMDFTKPQVMHIGDMPNKIDFLTKVQGLNFEEATRQSETLQLKNQQIPVLHFDHLIINKLLTGRTQDKADVEKLREIHRLKNRG
jgi:hypothetical protein